MKRPDLVDVAHKCFPLLDKIGSNWAVITIAGAGDEDDDVSVNFLFEKKGKKWKLKAKRFDANGVALGDWINLGTYKPLKKKYYFVPKKK